MDYLGAPGGCWQPGCSLQKTPCTLQACGNNYSMTWVKYIFKRHQYFFYQITISKITAAKGWQGRVWKMFLQDVGFDLKWKCNSGQNASMITCWALRRILWKNCFSFLGYFAQKAIPTKKSDLSTPRFQNCIFSKPSLPLAPGWCLVFNSTRLDLPFPRWWPSSCLTLAPSLRPPWV